MTDFLSSSFPSLACPEAVTVPSRHLSVSPADAEPSSPGLTEVRDRLTLGLERWEAPL